MSNDNSKVDKVRRRSIDCPVLVTERLILRTPHMEDVDAIADLANNQYVNALCEKLPFPYSRKDASNFVHAAFSADRGRCAYVITEAQTAKVVGCCSLDDYPDHDALEVGYWFGQPYWHYGYEEEALEALIDTAFRITDIERLYSRCLADHNNSRNSMIVAGFRHVQTLKHAAMVDGIAKTVALQLFAIDRIDWIALRSKAA